MANTSRVRPLPTNGRRRRNEPEVQPVQPDEDVETKRDRFFRIIEPRVQRCVHDIKLLAFGADRTRYDPTAGDVEAMEKALLDAVDAAMGPYRSRIMAAPTFRFPREDDEEKEEVS